MPCVCCDVHTYGGFLFIIIRLNMNVTTNELIPISENNGKRAVNARDLHAFLESKRDFSTWIKDRIKSYDFVEGVDFQSFTEIVEREIGATTRIEYALSISMAKELSMIENNERGKQARKYFIACEENKHELSRKELAIMVIQAEEEKERLALENEKQQKQIEKLQPKADFAEAAFKAEGKVDIGQAAKILGLPFGRNTLFKKLKEKGILFKRNEPKQKYVDAGYFELTQLPPIHRNNHPDIIVMKVLCTQKGLAYINHLFGGSKSDGKLAKIV
uniref:KilAC domain protein n=2 Tax=root TaxID=1 RepID=A0A8S5TXH8_9CAUD|nr:MAG TPA: KilAC domain protein [Siphoviridae sp. ctvBz3]